MKFATFNILDNQYAYFNNKLCKKTKVVSDNDENLRNSVLVKLFENNNIDILFLQEASKQFLNLLETSTLKDKFNISINNDLIILINKTISNNITIIDNTKYSQNEFVTKRLLAIKCDNIIFINIHLPPAALLEAKNNVLTITTNIVKDNPNNQFVIAGDMNTSNYTLGYLSKYDIKSIITKQMKDTYATSFKLGKCENNTFMESKKDARHFFIDDIYVSNTITYKDIHIIGLFDENYKFVLQDNKFKELGAPYCDPHKYTESGTCDINQSVNKYTDIFKSNRGESWPSDHALLYTTLILKQENNLIHILNKIYDIMVIRDTISTK